MSSNHHNPERKAWKGRSYRKGGKRIKTIRATIDLKSELPPDELAHFEALANDEEFWERLDEAWGVEDPHEWDNMVAAGVEL